MELAGKVRRGTEDRARQTDTDSDGQTGQHNTPRMMDDQERSRHIGTGARQRSHQIERGPGTAATTLGGIPNERLADAPRLLKVGQSKTYMGRHLRKTAAALVGSGPTPQHVETSGLS